MSELINEAFKEFKGIEDLDEELFSFDRKGALDLNRFFDKTEEPVLDIIDPLTTDEEELQPDYTGNVICQCCVCKQLIYKKPEDVVIDQETQRVNIDEECPRCCNTGGFIVIGQVEPYIDKDEVKVTVDDDEVDVQAAEEEEAPAEPVTESLKEDQEDGEVDADDFIGLRGVFKGFSADEAKQLYSTWDERRKGPTDPEELEDFKELKEMYGKTVEVVGCSVPIEGDNAADTFNNSYWEVEITEGTFKDGTNMAGLSLSGVSGYNIDLFDDLSESCGGSIKEDTVKTKRGWVNKGEAGTHGTFRTKKAADAQRRAMYASGWKSECLEEAKSDRAEPDKIDVEVTEFDIHYFDEDTGDVVVNDERFVGKDVKEGDYVTLHFTDEGEGADTQDYKFIRKTDLGYQLEWIGTESLYEDFQKATVETGDSVLSMESNDEGKITVTSEPRKAEEGGDEMIAPVSDEVAAEIESNAGSEEEEATPEETPTEEAPVEEETTEVEGEVVEEPAEGDEAEITVDEFEESYFNTLGQKYLQEVYNNVKSYETTRGTIDGNKIMLEGVITFTSGKRAKTSFIFEGKEITKRGKIKFLGENAQITSKGGAFTLCGTLKQGKLLAESLTYNYRTKDATTGRSVRLYGTVKR